MVSPLTRKQIVLVVLILAIGGSIFVWDNYFRYDPEKVYAKAEKEYIAAMTADTYGGKTPQETLDLFVAALQAEDVELASKYFMLDENLGREKWAKYITNLKREKNLSRLGNDIKNEAKAAGSLYEGNFQYKLYNDNGTVGLLISMHLNTYSSIWKIESM